ncbi:unnamed protein product [Mytilus edulis]|uniref:Uncharacterized protein n=1 Tax=Mytilus edulis TaxID=6550 RepID=A0A8S3QBL2_MYTED|nr:unnamed protein product [Mytilus edulis]
MDSDTPSDEISLRTVLDAVNRQKKDIEVLVDTKISEKINSLRDEIHGTSQCMKSQVKNTERLKQRNKVIKIADTSDGRWDTDRQYEANPIASDSEDESKIIRAENRATRKKKAKGKPAGKQQQIPSTANPSFNPQQPFRGDQPSWYGGFPYAQDQYAGKSQRGPCFNCGSYKHWIVKTAPSKTTRQQHHTKETSFVKDQYNFLHKFFRKC